MTRSSKCSPCGFICEVPRLLGLSVSFFACYCARPFEWKECCHMYLLCCRLSFLMISLRKNGLFTDCDVISRWFFVHLFGWACSNLLQQLNTFEVCLVKICPIFATFMRMQYQPLISFCCVCVCLCWYIFASPKGLLDKTIVSCLSIPSKIVHQQIGLAKCVSCAAERCDWIWVDGGNGYRL